MINIIDNFLDNLDDNSIWNLIEDYEKWAVTGVSETSYLRNTARNYCSSLNIPNQYHTDYMIKIAMSAYRHFAFKYKTIQNELN